jgi:hypothetical protein
VLVDPGALLLAEVGLAGTSVQSGLVGQYGTEFHLRQQLANKLTFLIECSFSK